MKRFMMGFLTYWCIVGVAVAGAGTIRLKWDPPADTSNVSYYSIYKGACGEQLWTVVASVYAHTTEWTDTNVVDGETYCYEVVALPEGAWNPSPRSNLMCTKPM